MKNDFMLKPKGLNMLSLPGQITRRVITAAIVIFFVILIGGLIHYSYLTVELAVLEVDKAATDFLEQIDKTIEELEEMERFHEWQQRKWNREFRER